MRRVRSFTGIWRVQRILYAIGDKNLPVPLTFAWIAWFVVTFAVMLMFGGFLSGIWRYGVIPVGVATVMGRLVFEGKRPDRFLGSVCSYLLGPKLTFAGKAVTPKKEKVNTRVTAVWRDVV
jgi:predicted small integral membrane protein